MKYLLMVLPILFIGCTEIQTVYVDENGSIIPNNPYRTINPEVVCDTRGYAYYSIRTGGKYSRGVDNGESYTPILKNTGFDGFTSHVLCKDL